MTITLPRLRCSAQEMFVKSPQCQFEVTSLGPCCGRRLQTLWKISTSSFQQEVPPRSTRLRKVDQCLRVCEGLSRGVPLPVGCPGSASELLRWISVSLSMTGSEPESKLSVSTFAPDPSPSITLPVSALCPRLIGRSVFRCFHLVNW